MNMKIRIILMLALLMTAVLFGCTVQDHGESSLAPGDIAPQSSVSPKETDSGTDVQSDTREDLMYVTGSAAVPLYNESGGQTVLKELACGETVIVKEKSGSVFFVSIPNSGDSGYVDSRYLVPDKNSVTEPFNAVIGENGAEVYASEGGTGDVIATLLFGDTAQVLAKTSGGYWRVVTADVVGYVNIMQFRSDSLPEDIFDRGGETDSEEASADLSDTDIDMTDTSSVMVSGDAQENGDFLDSAVSAAQAQAGGRWAAAYIDLQTGAAKSAGSTQMQSASLIKLYIMGAVYENYDEYAVRDASLDSLLQSMITVSDNASANALVALLGGGDTDAGKAAVTAYAQSHGYYSTSMGRLLLESNTNGDNYTSADDCARFLQAAYNGDLPHSSEMMSLLSQQTVTYKIPAGVPVATANKTGELDSVQNDAAVVYAQHPYVLCVMSENVSSGSAVSAIVDLSASVYAAVGD